MKIGPFHRIYEIRIKEREDLRFMKKRTLGNNGLETSLLGFGCMGLNYHRGPAKDRNEMIQVVHSL